MNDMRVDSAIRSSMHHEEAALEDSIRGTTKSERAEGVDDARDVLAGFGISAELRPDLS
jgi:hypothetical protein